MPNESYGHHAACALAESRTSSSWLGICELCGKLARLDKHHAGGKSAGIWVSLRVCRYCHVKVTAAENKGVIMSKLWGFVLLRLRRLVLA